MGSGFIDVCVDGWELVEHSRLNTLLIGPPTVTGRLVESLSPQLVGPVVRLRPHESLTFAGEDPVGTVILHDIGELLLSDQRRFLDWLDRASARPRVISTAPVPIIEKVAQGAFLPALYYRLNLFYVDVARVGNDVRPL